MDFKLRLMEAKDLALTLAWRNDPTVLRTAVTPNPISDKEHEAMFLHNNAIRLVFEVDGDPAGFVQVNRDPDELKGEWSFHMSKKYRGKKLSVIMLEATLYYLVTREGYKEVIAFVKEDNSVSEHLHQKLGFNDCGVKDGLIEFSKRL